ncbi:MAG: hypothetical protein KU37_03295 [Sulfuricurvum sp. PC08-66]|nr:MAG: hypothetical protein KU37_03295 [Sulfuricurvum sp. PC08-66]
MRTLFVVMMVWSVAWAVSPAWYAQSEFASSGNIYYGYGEDADQARAIAKAKEQIANAMQSIIQSEISTDTQVKNDEVTKAARQKLVARTDVVLSNARTYKAERVEGVWYVVVMFEHIAIAQQAKRALAEVACDKAPNPYLVQTPLVQGIHKELACPHAFEVWRSNGMWYLKSGSFSALLGGEDFDKLFATTTSEVVTLTASHPKLYEDEVFSFTVKTSKRGYLSLLTIYEDGKVGVLFGNAPIKPNQPMVFPDANSELELIAGLVEPNKPTKDLYIALLTPTQIDVSRFEMISDGLIEADSSFKMGEVIELMGQGDFATLLLRTYPRKF